MNALPLTLAFRLGVIGLTLALSGHSRAARVVAFVGSAIASVGTGLLAGDVLRREGAIDGVLYLHRASGLSLGYAVDGLSAWFLVVLATLAVPVAVYSLGYVANPHLSRRSAFVGALFNLLVGAVELVFAALMGLAMSVITGRFRLFSANLQIGALAMIARDFKTASSVSAHTAYRIPFAVAVAAATAVWLFYLW